MNTWIRADVVTGFPFKIFFVTDRQMAGLEMPQILARRCNDPEGAAKELEQAIEKIRPDLASCKVVGWRYRSEARLWLFELFHHSFERIGIYEIPEELPLIVEESQKADEPLVV